MPQLKIATGLLIMGLSLITTPITAQEYVNCLEIPSASSGPYAVMKCQQEQAQRLWNTINAQQQRISALQQEVTELKPKAAKVPGLLVTVNTQQQYIAGLQQEITTLQIQSAQIPRLSRTINAYHSKLEALKNKALKCRSGTRVIGQPSRWSPVSLCPSGYITVGLDRIDLLGRESDPTNQVNDFSCDDSGCRAWCTDHKCAVTSRCCRLQ
ncbi:hypothetical protein TI05_10160 [Achromatium sp. WMS3]|nr:hypothetical protein TI05_10160 [Achromatium sp. WMS3]